MKNSFSLVIVSFIVGILWLQYFSEQHIDFASQSEMYTDKNNMNCPSSDQIDHLHIEYKMEMSKDNFKCSKDDPRTNLYNTLMTIDRGSYTPEASWGPDFAVTSQNIKSYIRKYVDKISLSTKEQSSSIVSSYQSERWIEFSRRIIELNPIEMIAMLVHEVRHIEAPSRVHIRCGPGDMPGNGGACDEILLSEYKNMSSYNLEAYYLAGLAMFSSRMSETEKQKSAESSLKLIANRFNNFSDDTAYFHDVIYKLTEDRQLQVWHTYLKKWMNLPLQLLNDRIDHIENANDAFKISIFTEKGQFLTYSPFEGLKNYSESLNELVVSDATRIVVPNANNDSYMTVITNGQIKILSYQGEQGFRQLKNYPFVESNIEQRKTFKKIIYGDFNEIFWLDVSGKLFRNSQEKNQAPDLISVAELDANGPWRQGSPGRVYDDLYLVNQKHQIFRFEVKNKRAPEMLLEDEFQPEYYKLNQLTEWKSVQAVKYIQGAFGEYVLNTDGEIWLKRHNGSSEHQQIKNIMVGIKARDFAVMKMLIPSGLISNLLQVPLPEFKSKCQLTNTMWDPVLYKGMGLNQNGQLVFSDPNGDCQVLASVSDIKQYKFTNISTQTEKSHTDFMKNGMNFKSDVVLDVTTSSSQARIR